MERVDLLELEAAGLHHVERVRRRVAHLGAEGGADIAADRHLESRRLEHPAGQRRRRRFALGAGDGDDDGADRDRKSTRLNSSHITSSYAVLCLKKKCNEPMK